MTSIKEAPEAHLAAAPEAQEAVDTTVVQPIHEEVLQSPERPRKILKRRIIITGKEGSGKTTIADLLGELYGVPVKKVGQEFRKEFGDESEIKDRDKDLDERVDKYQARKFRESNTIEIWEARMGVKIAAEERRKRRLRIQNAQKKGETPPDDIEYVSILVTAPTETRMRRIWRKKVKEEKEKGIPESKRITLSKVRIDENARAAGDLRVWRATHPKLLGKNDSPFDPNSKDRDRNPEIDITAETDQRSPEQARDYIDRLLTQMGYVEEVNYESPQKNKRYKLTEELEEVRQILGWDEPTTIAELDDLEKALVVAYKIEAEEAEKRSQQTKTRAATPQSLEERGEISGTITTSDDLKNQTKEGVDKEKQRRQASPEGRIEVSPTEMGEKRVKEPKTNGHDTIGDKSEEVVPSGMDKGEPNTRTPQPDRHPFHPSRTKSKQSDDQNGETAA